VGVELADLDLTVGAEASGLGEGDVVGGEAVAEVVVADPLAKALQGFDPSLVDVRDAERSEVRPWMNDQDPHF